MRQQKFDKLQIWILFSLKADYRAQVLSLQFLKPPCFITEKKILSDPVDLQNKNFFKNMCEKKSNLKEKSPFFLGLKHPYLDSIMQSWKIM